MSDYQHSMPIMPDAPLHSEDKSQLIGTSSVNVTFSQDIIALEIANNSDNTVYLNIASSPAMNSTGIPIYSKGYYAAERKIKQAIGISLISDQADSDVRIVGHFDFECEIAN